MDLLRDPNWDPRRTAILNDTEELSLPGGASPGFAVLDTYEPDHVVVRTQADKPALMVLADNYLNGWTATVDGRPARVHRVNHTFRGVRVDGGSHVVELRFSPPGLRLGFTLYVSMLALLALYGAWELVRWRRASRGAAA